MNAFLRFTLVLASLVVAPAFAQNVCPTDPMPKCQGGTCKPHCAAKGEPVNMMFTDTMHVVRDLTMSTAGGPFELWRYYSSSPFSARRSQLYGDDWPVAAKAPFGNQSVTVQNSETNPKWSHDLFTFVDVKAGAPGPAVFNGVLGWLEFLSSEVSPVTHFLHHGIGSAGKPERLRKTTTEYMLVRKNGERWHYSTTGAPVGGRLYFLTFVEDRAGRRLYDVAYANPTVSGISNCGGSNLGPYISFVKFPPSAGSTVTGQLVFNYGAYAGQCVLTSIAYQPDVYSGALTTVASYTYGAGTQPDGLMASGGPRGERETYVHTSSSMTVLAPGGRTRVVQTYSAMNKVNGFQGLSHERDFTVATPDVVLWNAGLGSTYGVPAADTCAPTPQYYRNRATETATGGSPTSGTGILTSEYLSYEDTDYAGEHTGQFKLRLDVCPATGFCSEGSWAQSRLGALSPTAECDDTNPAASLFTKNKRGNWSGTSRSRHPSWVDDFFIYGSYRGASSAGGADYLEATQRDSDNQPFYDASWVRPSDPIRKPSSLKHGQFTWARDEFDAAGFRTKTLMTGWTRDITGAYAPVTRGIFFKKARQCTELTGNDLANRVLRVEGPCNTDNSANPTACVGTYPVTEFHYYPATAGLGDDTGRLRYVKRYPQGSSNCTSATPLITQYSGYTPEGMPRTVVDEAGVTATYQYDDPGTGRAPESGKRITQRTVNGQSTKYVYENSGELRSIEHPQGNFDVFCWYGLPTATPCAFPAPGTSQASQKPRLQWQAKSATNTGAAASERVNFEYAADGTLTKTTVLDSAGASRLASTVFPDAHGRSTWEGMGTTAPSGASVAVRRSFDGADNIDAVGESFSGGVAPDFCRVLGVRNGAASPLCSWMKFDRAERLTSLEQYPNGVDDATKRATCFDYDGQGNVRRVVAGCGAASQCSHNSSASGATDGGGFWEARTSCSNGAQPVDYEVDDFGDVVRVKTPWTSNATLGETFYAYDARGNVTSKQTEGMRATGAVINYVHDQLGRLSAVQQASPAVALYYFFYDTAYNGLYGGCINQTNTAGRLSARQDSFGITFYSYDAEGRVVKEQRVRDGASDCSTLWKSPSTSYTYSNNGNLTRIDYPHGRSVFYDYGTGGLTDRVAKVSAHLFLGGAPTLREVVKNVSWEPYGGLRGYQYMTGATGTNANSLEYFKGPTDNAVVTNACASYTNPPTAGSEQSTGRPRALWVSSGARTLGTGPGDRLKQVYTWNGFELSTTQTCFSQLGQTAEHRQNYVTARDGALTGVTGTGMPVRTSGAEAGVHSRTYSYDKRGNRSAFAIDGCDRIQHMNAAPGSDHLFWSQVKSSDPGCNGQFGGDAYHLDKDGNTKQLQGGYAWWTADLAYGNGLNFAGGAESVMKTVTLNGDTSGGGSGTYTYLYDAFSRRRWKQYPPGGVQEFFHDVGNRMLADVSTETMAGAGAWMVDDYIWLGGRAVAMVRGSLSTSWVRNLDSAASCNRLGNTGKCGLYHVINDYLPKPVMMVESSTNLVTNAALYDEFGHVNRTPLVAGAGGNGTFGTVSNPQGGVLDARAHFLFIDLPSSGSATMSGNGTSWVGTYSSKARVWTPWVYQGANGTTDVGRIGLAGGNGLMTDFIEYRRYSAGATPTWTPIRFPGQMHDSETDLFENWNRYYEPATGRYLQPEPLTQSNRIAEATAREGKAVLPYAYGLNSPTQFTDPTGLFIGVDDIVVIAAAGAAIAAYLIIRHAMQHPPLIGPVTWSERPPHWDFGEAEGRRHIRRPGDRFREAAEPRVEPRSKAECMAECESAADVNTPDSCSDDAYEAAEQMFVRCQNRCRTLFPNG